MDVPPIQSFYAHGKLLLTGEYFVLEGARALATPTRLGQWLEVFPLADAHGYWQALEPDGREWFAAVFDPITLEPRSATHLPTAQRLHAILEAAVKLNPAFREKLAGCHVRTRLEFPRLWGLGSSSTLIANIARWAQVDAFALLRASFGGSGYDLAAATLDKPFLFWRTPTSDGRYHPHWQEVAFRPPFADQLWFIYLGGKQDSREAIAAFKAVAERLPLKPLIDAISRLTQKVLEAHTLQAFEDALLRHEEIVAHTLSLEPIQQARFPDYEAGVVKSLGAWGGDFALASSRMSARETRAWFAEKGYPTCVNWKEMVAQ